MQVVYSILLVLLFSFVFWRELPTMTRRKLRREKVVFLILSLLAFTLSILLILQIAPTPPTQIIVTLFESTGKLLTE